MYGCRITTHLIREPQMILDSIKRHSNQPHRSICIGININIGHRTSLQISACDDGEETHSDLGAPSGR